MSKGWLVMTTATWSAIIRGRQSWGLSHLLGRCFRVVRAACCSRLVKMGASYKIPYSGKWGLTNTAFLGSCGWWIHGAGGWREEEEEGEGEEGKRKKNWWGRCECMICHDFSGILDAVPHHSWEIPVQTAGYALFLFQGDFIPGCRWISPK